MLNTVLYIIIIGSLLGIVIILSRKIPVLAQLSENEVAVLKSEKGLIVKTTSKIKKADYSSYTKTTTGFFKVMLKWLKEALTYFLKFDFKVLGWLGYKVKAIAQFIYRGPEKVGGIIKNIFVNIASGIKEKTSNWQKERQAKKEKEQTIFDEKDEEDNSFNIKKVSTSYFKNETEDNFSEAKMIEQDLAGKKSSIELKEEKRIDFADLGRPIQEEQELIDIIVKNPKNIIAYKALGLMYFKQCNYKDAEASLTTATKLGSKDKIVQEVLEKIKNIPNNDL